MNKIYYAYRYTGEYFEYHIGADRDKVRKFNSLSRRWDKTNPNVTAKRLAESIYEIEREIDLYGAIRA